MDVHTSSLGIQVNGLPWERHCADNLNSHEAQHIVANRVRIVQLCPRYRQSQLSWGLAHCRPESENRQTFVPDVDDLNYRSIRARKD